jgi:GT2 family glycosyltransferase
LTQSVLTKSPPTRPSVSVVITTYNSAAVLEPCLNSVAALDYSPLEVVIVDNASTDETRDVLRRFEDRFRIIYNQENRGFSGGQNQAIRTAAGNWLVSLNPDILVPPDFLNELIAAGEVDHSVGMLTGKLLRWMPDQNEQRSRIIDSTGIFFTRNLRHLDRGAEEPDRGQYDQLEYVFGATGAAAAFSRRMIEDVSINGEFFDEDFFAYREDADLSWRAQLMGWKCLYVPTALAWHVRRVTPERREQLPLLINWHSIKNRFLMRAKNISAKLYLQLAVPVTWRDLLIVGYCVLKDRRLFSALTYVWRRRRSLAAKRRVVQARRRVPDSELARWFSDRPVSFPAAANGAFALAGEHHPETARR